MVQDCFLGEKNMNLLFNFNNVHLLFKTMWGDKRPVFILEYFNCKSEGGEVGKVGKVAGY